MLPTTHDLACVLQASTVKLNMPLLVTDFTQDLQQARPATPVDPTGLISFARQAPQQAPQQHSAMHRPPSRQGLNRQRGQQAKLQVKQCLWMLSADSLHPQCVDFVASSSVLHVQSFSVCKSDYHQNLPVCVPANADWLQNHQWLQIYLALCFDMSMQHLQKPNEMVFLP